MTGLRPPELVVGATGAGVGTGLGLVTGAGVGVVTGAGVETGAGAATVVVFLVAADVVFFELDLR
jgi:hypothetical protein